MSTLFKKVPDDVLEKTWKIRKDKLNALGKKNIFMPILVLAFPFGFFSFAISVAYELPNFLIGYFWFVGIFIFLAIITNYRIGKLADRSDKNSRSQRYLYLLFLEDLYLLALFGGICIGSFEAWLEISGLRLVWFDFILLLPAFLVILILWLPGSIKSPNYRKQPLRRNPGGMFQHQPVGVLILIALFSITLLIRIYQSAEISEFGVLSVFFLFFSLIFFGLLAHYFYRDYLLIKRGYLDK